uniref:Laminin EGF-like domain-containing protein n=1 Tax=Meloidogyne hapla TaxID=6305 RepID=A0A1I8BI20_MELHA
MCQITGECLCFAAFTCLTCDKCSAVLPGELLNIFLVKFCFYHWDLQPHHSEVCIDRACHMIGTLSLSNDCDQLSGQCQCKRFGDVQKCDFCQAGFYNIRADSSEIIF